jgi:hypothetical protein
MAAPGTDKGNGTAALLTPTPAPLKQIREEIAGGLANHRAHLDDARRSLAFYKGDFRRYVAVKGDTKAEYQGSSLPRASLFAQRVANILTKDLYKDAPKRSVPGHVAANAWLEDCYRANNVDAKWQEADRLALVTDFAAFQAVPSSDPRCPVRLMLWDASQLIVWEDPDDATRPMAVAVLDLYDEQRRLRLWTETTVETWMTKKLGPTATAGGTAFEPRGARPNQFGFLPFAFVHFTPPVTDFRTPGLGGYLADVTAWACHALTRTAESIEFNLRPILLTRGLRPGSGPPRPLKPGAVWHLEGRAEEEGGAEPSAEYLMADSSFVAASWEDIKEYLDHVADVTGTPKAALRMDVDAMRSGTSIAQEQAPLADWAKSRQRAFAGYEQCLAELALRVAARHLGADEQADDYRASAAELAAAYDSGALLSVRWPPMRPELNGTERDQHFQWLLDNRLTSRVEVAKAEHNLTDEEAREYLEKVADDLLWEHTLFAPIDQSEAEASGANMAARAEAGGDSVAGPGEAKAKPGDKAKADPDEDA